MFGSPRRARPLVALVAGVAGAASLVHCASHETSAPETTSFAQVDALVKTAWPVTRTNEGFRLASPARTETSAWTAPPSPLADLPRSASSPMWISAPGAGGGARIGVTHESFGSATAKLEDGGRVVRFDGDDAHARIFAHASEVEEIVVLDHEAKGGIAYGLALSTGFGARTVPSGSGAPLVEIDDAHGEPQLRMRADRAWDAEGRALAVTMTLDGDRVTVGIDPKERDVRYPVAIDPSWFSAASPSRIRSGHTATLLGTGRVLVAGGGSAPDSTELFDTVTGRFTPGPAMHAKRTNHTATLLFSGKVLLCGGGVQYNGGDDIASCELYDPITNTFTVTGSMKTARGMGQTAVRLPSGNVMVVGGVAHSGIADPDVTVEIYDASKGTFSFVAPRDSNSSGSGALANLPSGKVLFAGHGSASEVFDPTTNGGMGSWAGVSVPPIGGAKTTTLMRNGMVLITGAKACGTAGPPINCGTSGGIFDPTAAGGIGSVTSSTPDLPGPGATATLLPTGEVLFTGGGVPVSTASTYDPQSNGTTADSAMANVHSNHTATVLPNGDVLVLGGDQAGVELRPAPGRIATLGNNMTTGRVNHSAIRLRNGKVLIVGGCINVGIDSSALAEIFDPIAGTFVATGSLKTARLRPRLSLLPSGNVLVTGGAPGGSGSAVLSSAEIYDVAGGTFRAISPMKTARTEHAAIALNDGTVFISGGCAAWYGGPQCNNIADNLDSSEIFDPTSESFHPGPKLLAPHAGHGMVRLPSGKVLIVGGTDAELYDPKTGTLAATTSPGASRDGRTAHLLPSGKVFIAGGNTLAAELYDPATAGWAFGGSLPFVDQDVVWRGTVEGRMVSSGGMLFEGVEPRGMLYDPLTLTGNGEVAFTSTARGEQTATLLSTGGVLIAGGWPCYGNCIGNPYATAAVWSEGAPTTARPVMTQIPPTVAGGATITITGHGFADSAEGSSGATGSSAMNAPQAFWLAEGDEAVIPGKVLAFTDTSITWTASPTALAGPGTLHVSVGGVVSVGAPLQVTPALQATACTWDADCASGFCTDGVCCDKRCDGKCEGCSAARKTNGVDGVCGAIPLGHDRCFALQGQACSDASQCATGFCVSGVCCDSSCTGSCLSCTQPDHLGSCSAISEGNCDVACDGDHTLKKIGSPDVDCAPFKCDGKACRPSCASARDCVEPAVCNYGGLCVPPTEASPSDETVWGCSSAGPRGGNDRPSGLLVAFGALAASLVRAARKRRGR